MFQGLLRPLAATLPLCNLLAHVRPRETLGAWVSITSERRRICIHRTGGDGASLLLSQDLGFLLSRCGRVVVRQEELPLVLSADTVICWRALQVATATPYLPGLERMQTLFPGLRVTSDGFLVPVRKESPERVLALCIEEGIRVAGTRIVYQSGTSPPRDLR